MLTRSSEEIYHQLAEEMMPRVKFLKECETPMKGEEKEETKIRGDFFDIPLPPLSGGAHKRALTSSALTSNLSSLSRYDM